MAISKTWTTQAELATWSWVNEDTTSVPGSVQVEAGQYLATGTSPDYQADPWAEWRAVRIPGNRPTATGWQFRFKVAATQGGLGAATYSDWLDGIDDNDVLVFDMATWIANNAAWDVGPWIVMQVTLRAT